MVLFIKTDSGQVDVERCPKDVNSLLQSCSPLKLRSQEFASKSTETITPDKGLVYVGQSEMAVGVADDDNVSFFGSEDATTCHVVILRHQATGATGLAHIDQVNPDQLEDLIEKLLQISDTILPQAFDRKDALIDLSLVGGYDDERQISKKISIDLIKWVFKSEYNFCLNILVLGELNTDYSKSYPSPRFLGAGIELKSGSIFPAKFPDHGPDNILRHVRLSHRNDDDSEEPSAHLFSLYNHETGEIRIPTFKVRQLSQEYEFLTRVPDQIILQNFSTSPKVEPAHFATEIRECIKFVLTHPRLETTFFKDAAERVYRRCEASGKWILKSD